MMNNEKILKNTLISERLYKINKEERKEILIELLKTNTQRGLAKELGIPHATLHDWVSLRQSNKGKNAHISFNGFFNFIIKLNPEDIKDWGRLQMIQNRIKQLFRSKNFLEK